jgi:cell division protein FtsN
VQYLGAAPVAHNSVPPDGVLPPPPGSSAHPQQATKPFDPRAFAATSKSEIESAPIGPAMALAASLAETPQASPVIATSLAPLAASSVGPIALTPSSVSASPGSATRVDGFERAFETTSAPAATQSSAAFGPSMDAAPEAPAAPAPEPQTPAAFSGTQPMPSTPGFYLQAGSFADLGNALRQREKLAQVAPSFITSVEVRGSEFFRVMAGPWPTREAARAAVTGLSSVERDAIVVLHRG